MLRGCQRCACPRGAGVMSQRARGRDGSGWPCPRARSLGRSEGGGHRPPRPARRDRSRRNRRGCHSSLGMLTPDRLRTSSQPGPVRSMTRIRPPGSGKPRAHRPGKPGKLKGLRRVRANPAAIWMTRRPAASGPPRLRVVWCRGRGSRPEQYVPPCYPAHPGEDACVASQPGQPGAEPGTARRGPAIEGVIAVAGAAGSGTASARRAGGRLLSAPAWSLRRSGAGCGCSRAGRRPWAGCSRRWYRRCHGRG
jgi:hypothetical protein